MSAAPLCSRCTALCCRLTVVLQPGDEGVPEALVEHRDDGLRVMARGEDGYCRALSGHRCGIYAVRPAACRRFLMAGPYCLAVREDAARALDPAA